MERRKPLAVDFHSAFLLNSRSRGHVCMYIYIYTHFDAVVMFWVSRRGRKLQRSVATWVASG